MPEGVSPRPDDRRYDTWATARTQHGTAGPALAPSLWPVLSPATDRRPPRSITAILGRGRRAAPYSARRGDPAGVWPASYLGVWHPGEHRVDAVHTVVHAMATPLSHAEAGLTAPDRATLPAGTAHRHPCQGETHPRWPRRDHTSRTPRLWCGDRPWATPGTWHDRTPESGGGDEGAQKGSLRNWTHTLGLLAWHRCTSVGVATDSYGKSS